MESLPGRRLKLIGMVFGRLTVVKYYGLDRFHRTMWECQCSCGNVAIIPGTNLTHGTKSCGCLTREVPTWTTNKLGSGATKPNGVSAFNDLYSSYRYRSKKSKLEFSLSKDSFRFLTESDCYYCGEPPTKLHGRNDLNGGYVYNGIDRMNNKKGYVLGNCVPCCALCNYAKNRMESDRFLKLINKIYKHQHGG